jgi:hypothetical protein
VISVLRSIGDAIAFIYGNRWDIKQMVMKEESGFITGKRGTRLERKILRKAFEIGATVVMNDLTHTLRHGDARRCASSSPPMVFHSAIRPSSPRMRLI